MQQKTVQISRLVIGAPKGCSGKSVVTMGLLAALVSTRGLKVQFYKKGPDSIDSDWLARATGRPCRNLDSFLMSREVIRQSFIRHAVSVDLGIVEGVDGLYDGVDLS
ncbi:MAG TPA: cobyrinic acid a,c-diamide synthase, partial [Desulfosporosinus sp.]|nr:cobyrinic acid a,c-diamide synthase [Desulfosporosinus sp.]